MTADDIIDEIIAREGGYVNDPDDAGGATRYGITEKVARAHGYKGDMKSLSRDTAVSIYKSDYWTGPRFDQIGAVNMEVAVELMDTGVNMGPAAATKFLQRCLNVFNQQGRAYPDMSVDGMIGPRTVAAFRSFVAARGKEGVNVMLKSLNSLQGARYIELAEQRPANESFVYGWMANRVSL